MSTNLNCEIIEPFPGTWYYVLEDGFAPKNAWDWREYATATGPFPTEEAAREYLCTHESNPGGTCTIPNAEFEMKGYEKLLSADAARKPQLGMGSWF